MTHTCTYRYEAGGKDELVIEFDYQPYEKQTWDEPGCAESADVVAVYANGLDILEWVSTASVAFFEEKCLESMAQDRVNATYDRGADRYEDRMGA